MSEIKNLETRMKLIVRENEMLKQLLIRDQRKTVHCEEHINFDKKNMHFKANYQ